MNECSDNAGVHLISSFSFPFLEHNVMFDTSLTVV